MLYDPKWEQKAETRRILHLAASLIETNGHAKNALEDERGGLCLLGAIHKAQTGDAARFGDNFEPYRLLMGAIGGDIATWNNTAERTGAEASAMLRQAAA
jgi:hypothetical protein